MDPQRIEPPAVLRTSLRLGACAVLFLPLYVSSSLLFPYVTGRNFAFRILTELLLVPLVALWWMSKPHRPRLSALTVALLAFLVAVAVADMFGVNPSRSFWSTYQRMEGLLGLIHLVLFFLILRTAFTSIEEWTRYFRVSVAVSALVAVVALFQFAVMASVGTTLRPGGTVGNAGTLGAYLMLHGFLALLLVAGEGRVWVRRLLIGHVTLVLGAIYVSGTKSVWLALLIVVPIVVAVWFGPSLQRLFASRLRRLRFLLGVAGVGVLLATVGIPLSGNFAFYNSLLARLSAWSAAWQGIRDRLWIGWGQENFYMVSDRYNVPTAIAFDRPHNLYLGWLMDGGVLALGAWVALIVVFGRTVWSISPRDRAAAIVLNGLLAAYLIFNFFWFDTFETYMPLIGVMAFADWYARTLDWGTVTAAAAGRYRLSFAGAASVAAACALSIATISWLNVRPMLVARHTVAALNAWASGRDLDATHAAFEKALSYSAVPRSEVIERMAGLVPDVVVVHGGSAPAAVRRFADRATRELAALTASPLAEVKHLRLLGSAYGSASALVPPYRPLAVEAFNRALAIAPRNVAVYEALTRFHVESGDIDTALAMQRRAIQLAPASLGLQLELIRLAVRTGRASELERGFFQSHLREYATIASLQGLAVGYLRTGDLELARLALAEALRREPANAQLAQQYRTIVRRIEESTRAASPVRPMGQLRR